MIIKKSIAALVTKILIFHNANNNNKLIITKEKNYKMSFEKIKNLLEKHKNTIKSVADLSNIIQSLAATVTVVGIVFIGLEYHTQQKTNRQAKAFELYQHFNTNNFMEIRNELKKNFYEEFIKTPVKGSKALKDLNEEEYIKRYKSNWENKDGYIKIISITNFLEQVATCVQKELCDEEAAMTLFGTEAQEFFQTYYQFFEWHREKNGNKYLGITLEKFVKKYENKENKNENKDLEV